MNDLITISNGNIGSETVQTVNARELHAFLEVGKDFSTWVKDRIESFEFVENRDFVCSPILGSEGRGGKNRIDYHLTLDMAKELSMVERNEKGKQARLYFIECERRVKHIDPYEALNDPAAMRGLLLTYSEKVIQRDKLIADMQPKVEALTRLSMADGSLCITNAAKTLQVQPKFLFNLLSQNKFIYRRPGCNNWIAYQDKLQTGYLEHKITTIERTGTDAKTVEQVLVTPKGLVKLAAMLCH